MTESPNTTPFLKLVADDLRHTFGADLSRVAVVCPNKRASLFLNEYFAPDATSGQTVWAPRYLTISQLFCSLSPLTVADPIETICRLHKLYTSLTGSTDSLDFFYGWGERLLADFDDVDKHRADAARLFRNLSEIKRLEDPDFLDEEKEKVLRAFFADFSLTGNTRLRQKFLALWNVMSPMYTQLNAELLADGLAYEGALYRGVIEALERGELSLPADIEHFAFVGFNVLDTVEESLFSFMQKRGIASFYWDYDVAYTNTEATALEAGTFLRANLERFPNRLAPECFNNLLRGEKEVEFVAASSENAQARAATTWIKKHLTADEKRTAIILCNENLLQPLLHALPPEVKEANVTKGYPLHHTHAYHLAQRLLEERAAQETNAERLTHAMETVRAEAAEVSSRPESLDKTLDTEACFQVHSILSRFHHLVTERGLAVEPLTLQRLVRQVMRQTSIPFHGEPATGLQIMGVLETRCLDFENVLMLSVNEGNLPQKPSNSSFIPHVLRREFGLTTERHKIAVFAYYFYRLLQRARHVRLVYNCSTGDGTTTGEMSRFMTQLLVETPLQIKTFAIASTVSTPLRRPTAIDKPADIAQTLTKLSPSDINTYLRCQLLFFYQHVAHLSTPQLTQGLIAPNVFGSAFHRSAELFYKRLAEKADGRINEQMLRPWLESEKLPVLQSIVRQAMKEEDAGSHIVVEDSILNLLKLLIANDCHLKQFRLMATELHRYIELPIALGEGRGNVNMRISGIIDRLDIVDEGGREALRILDYKTGGKPQIASSIESLFVPATSRAHYVLQVLIYALFMEHETSLPLRPALLYLHKAAADDYTPAIFIGKDKEELCNARPYLAEFKERLTALVTEILDTSRPFQPTEIKSNCTGCDFHDLCYN